MHLSILLLACMVLACSAADFAPFSSLDRLKDLPLKDSVRVSSCNVCNSLAASFLKAMAETMRQSFAGGDTAWEEEKLGSYENSELRFIEIQEELCADVASGKDQCYNLAEQYEHELEDWFFKRRMKKVDLFAFLCIDQLKLCCPNNTYGPNCIPCPGGVEEACGGHGKCLNGGTREEPASCLCDPGYTGELCDVCEEGHYRDADGCKSCDGACKRHCRGPGPRNCEVCSSGYQFLEDEGCVKNDSFGANIASRPNETEDPEFRLNPELETAPTEHSEL